MPGNSSVYDDTFHISQPAQGDEHTLHYSVVSKAESEVPKGMTLPAGPASGYAFGALPYRHPFSAHDAEESRQERAAREGPSTGLVMLPDQRELMRFYITLSGEEGQRIAENISLDYVKNLVDQGLERAGLTKFTDAFLQNDRNFNPDPTGQDTDRILRDGENSYLSISTLAWESTREDPLNGMNVVYKGAWLTLTYPNAPNMQVTPMLPLMVALTQSPPNPALGLEALGGSAILSPEMLTEALQYAVNREGLTKDAAVAMVKDAGMDTLARSLRNSLKVPNPARHT